MTVDPLLPPALLASIAAALIVLQVVAWRLRPPAHRKSAAWRSAAISVAGLLMLAAAERPTIGDSPAPRAAGDLAPNVFLVIDRSPDMSTSDVDEAPRVALVRRDIDHLIDRYPNARFAVIGFAFRPSLDWPLSADTWSLRAVVTAMPSVPTAQGTDIGAAATVLRYQLVGATQRYPRAKNLVFYLGAGTPAPSEPPPQEFNLAADSVSGGAVLGYGSNAAGSLPAVARQIGVPYLQRTAAQPLDPALPNGAPAVGTPEETMKSSGLQLYWILSLPAAALLLVVFYQALRDFGRVRWQRVGLRL